MAEFEKVLDVEQDEPQMLARLTLTQEELMYLQSVCEFAGENGPDYVTKGNGNAYGTWIKSIRESLSRRSLRSIEEFKAVR